VLASWLCDLRDSRYPDEEVLHFSAAEWAEFLAKAKSGQFDHALSGACASTGETVTT
jgi:Domain of unknown function (DUF397)